MIDWIFKNVKVTTAILKTMIDDCDIDKDGYINVEELITILKTLVRK